MAPTFKRIGDALVFIHPCECGNPVAPFGSGVRLCAAIAAKNAALAGKWFCVECRREEKTK